MTRRLLLLLIPLLMIAAGTSRAETRARDSIMMMLDTIEDSRKLLGAHDVVTQNINKVWVYDIIEYAISLTSDKELEKWRLFFLGSKVRWALHMRDWRRVDEFLLNLRKETLANKMWQSYVTNICEVSYISALLGRFEPAWHYLEMLEKDLTTMTVEEREAYGAYWNTAAVHYYKCVENYKECNDIIAKSLRNTANMSPDVRVPLHSIQAEVNCKLGKYETAIAHADSVDYIYSNDPVMAKHAASYEDMENIINAKLIKAECYMNLGDTEKMRQTLIDAEKDAEAINADSDVRYWWAKYHFIKKDYQRCLELLDTTATLWRAEKTEYEAIKCELEKVKVLRAMGRDDEAFEYYTSRLTVLDSVSHAIIRDQQEYLNELSEALSKKDTADKLQHEWRMILPAVVFALLFLVIFISYKVVMAHRQIITNYRITKDKLEEANRSDKEKERFLRNITKLIDEPLQKVVAGAKRLAEDTTIPQEEQQRLLAENKQFVARLLDLVNNVLDLSRLEAQMMRYDAYPMDVVVMVMEFVSTFNMRNMENPIRLVCEQDTFERTMDATRFSNMLQTIFSVPFECPLPVSTKRSIKTAMGENGAFEITVSGSLFAYEESLTETERMKNSINMYVMRDFKSKYFITEDKDIVITLSPD